MEISPDLKGLRRIAVEKSQPAYTPKVPSRSLTLIERNLELLHTLVIWPATALRRNPCNDLVGIHNVARFAVDTIRCVEVNFLPARSVRRFHHFIHARGTEILAGVAKLRHASFIANVGVVNHQVRRLVFFMLGARVIDVGQLVERQLAVALGSVDHVRFRATVGEATGKAASCAHGPRDWCNAPATRVRR